MVNSSYSSLSPNLGLLDARATGRTLFELRQKFLPVDFFDLCSIIEEIVLRAKIVLVGKYPLLPKPYRDALQPLVAAGVFDICVDRVTIKKLEAVSPTLRLAADQTHAVGLTSSTAQDADYEVTRLLAAETDLRIPTIPLLRHLHNYGFTRRPAIDNAVCDLSEKFADIRGIAEDILRQEALRLRLHHISVPPIALEVLQRARTFDQLMAAILEKRHEYRRLRTTMSDLAEVLADPALNADAYYRLKSEWDNRWQQATDSAIAGTMGMGLSSPILLAHGFEIMTALQDEHYVGVALGSLRLLRDSRKLLRQRLFRPVHYSVRNYMRSGHRGMADAVGRLFDIDPYAAHRHMASVATNSMSVWRRASAVNTPAEPAAHWRGGDRITAPYPPASQIRRRQSSFQ